MSDTTIRLDTAVRDKLRALAEEDHVPLGDLLALLLTRSGASWKPVKPPVPPNAGLSNAANPFAWLSAVSCPSPSYCTAVGGYSVSSGDEVGLLLTS